MTSHPNRNKRAVRLTPAQIKALLAAADFVLAGEWPDGFGDIKPATLERAVAGLTEAQ